MSTSNTAPSLAVPGRRSLDRLYAAAVHNVTEINTRPGRTPREPARYLRAGAGYDDPWTRDAALNAWGAASFVTPDVARDTLLAVCDHRDDGSWAIRQDDQWWDQLVWVPAAWQHYLATHDVDFLRTAHAIATGTVRIVDAEPSRFRADLGLFTGGALMQDGISGYPAPPADLSNPSSFVLDHPAARDAMCLSTNVVGLGAFRALAGMSAELGLAPDPWTERADALGRAITTHLWDPLRGTYGYLVHGSGAAQGVLDEHQETAGLALAVTFGLVAGDAAGALLAGVHHEPFGVVNVWPHFADRYSDDRPGRHNAMCWPMVMGLFGDAAAVARRADLLDRTLVDLENLVCRSGGRYDEVYDPRTGEPDGGWQTGRRWHSEPDQTWSATAFLRLVHLGVLGLRPTPGGLTLRPLVPSGFGTVAVSGLRYANALLDVEVVGEGGYVLSVESDGERVPRGRPLTFDQGRHRVRVVVAPAASGG